MAETLRKEELNGYLLSSWDQHFHMFIFFQLVEREEKGKHLNKKKNCLFFKSPVKINTGMKKVF